ncbi:MAG: hypothetical protein JWN48_4945 [Myxococcaceae bacterium]|nr:hypothetical protein [Myxococcaceae bacterium]
MQRESWEQIRRAAAGCIVLLACSVLPRARADEAVRPATGVRDESAHSAAPMSAREYWSSGRPRPFAAVVLDAGASVRGRLMLGYGKPHWTWAGLELEAASTSDTAITAARARIALVVADVALAFRRTSAYRRTWVEREQSYSDADLKGRPRASYRSLDLDVWGLIPAGSGLVQWELETVRLYGIPRNADVYEEWLRAPVRPPWTTAARLAYAYTFWHGRASAGAMGEWLWLGGRGALYRLGPLLSYAFTPHWEATLLLTTPVSSPDQLSFFSGLYGTIRVRWKFASGERGSIFH